MKEIDDSLQAVEDRCRRSLPGPVAPILMCRLEETAGALKDSATAGKIRRGRRQQFFAGADGQAFRAVVPLATDQPPYNLFEREVERDILPYSQRQNIATLAYGAPLPRPAGR